MNQRTLRLSGAPQHTAADETDASLQAAAREHVNNHPGLQFLADVLTALHAPPNPLRDAKAFLDTFAPQEMMNALGQRPDLRVRVLKALTGGPTALLRRLPAAAVSAQIELLAIDDLPEAERGVRAEADRALSVQEIYLKYLEPLDVATYFAAQTIWRYEARNDWWKAEPTAATRALMAAELRSIRRNAILSDSEFLDLLGEEALETYLPVAVRTALRKAARRAATDARPFSDSDLFAGAGGGRDLIDEMVDNIPLPELREVTGQAAALLGLRDTEATPEPVQTAASNGTARPAATIPPPAAPPPRLGPKPATAGLPGAAAKPIPSPPPAKKTANASKPIPNPPPARPDASQTQESDAPPQPDDDLAILEEITGRLGLG